MSLNYKEIDLILHELDLRGSRIDKINQYDRFSLYLETFGLQKKQKIVISLTHGALRINRTGEKPLFPDYPLRFAQLLRSRIKGGRILSASQPSGQRIVKLTISCSGSIFLLWIRLWGGNPNIILTDDHFTIIDTLFRKKSLLEIAGEQYNPDFITLALNNNKTREIRPYSSITDFNTYIENFYSSKNHFDDFERIKEKKIKTIDDQLNKINFHLTVLKKRKERFSSWESLREKGEILQSNLYQLKKGQQTFTTENYFSNNEMIEIELKQDLNPLENSTFYFKKYKKYKEGLLYVTSEIETVEKMISDLKDFREKVLQSLSLEELNDGTESVASRKPGREKNQIGLLFHSGGYTILVGRNSRENDQLLRKKVRGNDIWLHVRDFPGGFVLIKTIKGKTVPLEILLDGANLALLYSSKKYKDKADIHYTEVKNLRRVKGEKEGMVLANNERNLFISYDESRIKKLQLKDPLLETKVPNLDN
jgi:predicted ribosome quality control (RQC) complex YloA/Tae2 family protein